PGPSWPTPPGPPRAGRRRAAPTPTDRARLAERGTPPEFRGAPGRREGRAVAQPVRPAARATVGAGRDPCAPAAVDGAGCPSRFEVREASRVHVGTPRLRAARSARDRARRRCPRT